MTFRRSLLTVFLAASVAILPTAEAAKKGARPSVAKATAAKKAKSQSAARTPASKRKPVSKSFSPKPPQSIAKVPFKLIAPVNRGKKAKTNRKGEVSAAAVTGLMGAGIGLASIYALMNRASEGNLSPDTMIWPAMGLIVTVGLFMISGAESKLAEQEAEKQRAALSLIHI